MDSSPQQPLTHAQIDMISEHTHRATSKALRNYVRGAVLGLLVVLIAVGYVLSTKPDTGSLRAGLISSCERVNILRAQSNNSDLVSFKILSISAQRERALTKTDGAINKPLHSRSAHLLAAEAQQLTVTGLTYCPDAVDHAKTYKFPIANPVGDPIKAKVSPEVVQIVKDSRALLEHYRSNGGRAAPVPTSG